MPDRKALIAALTDELFAFNPNPSLAEQFASSAPQRLYGPREQDSASGGNHSPTSTLLTF
jgi:hypothetical protein